MNLTALWDQAHAGLRSELERAMPDSRKVVAVMAEMLRACVDAHERARGVMTAGVAEDEIDATDVRMRSVLYLSALEYVLLIAGACDSVLAGGMPDGIS